MAEKRVTNPLHDGGSDEEAAAEPPSAVVAERPALPGRPQPDGRADGGTSVSTSSGGRLHNPHADAGRGHVRHKQHIYTKAMLQMRSQGVDPYVSLFLGLQRGKKTVHTESVVGTKENNNGKDPCWTPKQCFCEDGDTVDNVLYVTPSESDKHLTIEVWDADLGSHDDLLGGHTLNLPEMKQLIADSGGSRVMNVQLFERPERYVASKGYVRGHDAGVLRLLASFADDSAQTIRLEVQAAVDLLPDTPHIRDLRTFADWRNTIILLSVLMVYLLLGSLFFRTFFKDNACEHAACEGATANSTAGEYPGDGGPFLDALIFMINTATTTGWGSQPVNLASVPDAEHEDVYELTKLFTVFSIILMVGLLGMLMGSLGESFRSFFRAHNIMVYSMMAATPLVESGPDGEKAAFEKDRGKVRLFGSVNAVALAFLSLSITTIAGSLAFSVLEEPQLGWVDALYLTVVSISTVGYGDLAPSTAASKWFAVFFIPVGVAFMANALDTISNAITSRRQNQLEDYVLGQFGSSDGLGSLEDNDLTPFDFEELVRSVNGRLAVVDPGPEGVIMTRNTFRLAMLMRLGVVNPDHLRKMDEVFSQLDSDNSGRVEQEEIVKNNEDGMRKRKERLSSRWEEHARAEEDWQPEVEPDMRPLPSGGGGGGAGGPKAEDEEEEPG